MHTFFIYHPKGGLLNIWESLDKEFECIGSVQAKNINDAFVQSQNDFNEDYRKLCKRSTCVGDIIVPLDGKAQMVSGLGFTEVPGNLFQHTKCITPDVLRSDVGEQFD